MSKTSGSGVKQYDCREYYVASSSCDISLCQTFCKTGDFRFPHGFIIEWSGPELTQEKISFMDVAGIGLSHNVTVLLLEIHSTEIKSVPLTPNPALKPVV